MQFNDLISSLNSIVWGPLTLMLLVGTGIYFTVKLKLIQVFRLPLALRLLMRPSQGKGSCHPSPPCARRCRPP